MHWVGYGWQCILTCPSHWNFRRGRLPHADSMLSPHEGAINGIHLSWYTMQMSPHPWLPWGRQEWICLLGKGCPSNQEDSPSLRLCLHSSWLKGWEISIGVGAHLSISLMSPWKVALTAFGLHSWPIFLEGDSLRRWSEKVAMSWRQDVPAQPKILCASSVGEMPIWEQGQSWQLWTSYRAKELRNAATYRWEWGWGPGFLSLVGGNV